MCTDNNYLHRRKLWYAILTTHACMNISRETVPDVPTFIHLLLSNKGCACMHEHNKQTNVVRAMASPVNYEFVDKVPEDHHCTICTNILTDPVLTELQKSTAKANCKSELQKRTAKVNCRSELQK